jgi:hypothetical protein
MDDTLTIVKRDCFCLEDMLGYTRLVIGLDTRHELRKPKGEHGCTRSLLLTTIKQLGADTMHMGLQWYRDLFGVYPCLK